MKDYQRAHDELLAKLEANPDNMDFRMQLMSCIYDWANDTTIENGPYYKLVPLAREVLKWGPLVIETGPRGMNLMYLVTSKLETALTERPRLRLKILRLKLEILDRQEMMADHCMDITDDIRDEIGRVSGNIKCADDGNYESMRKSEYDHVFRPVEWTAKWEEVIDQAEAKAYATLAEAPEDNNMSQAIRPALNRILEEDYGIKWIPAE